MIFCKLYSFNYIFWTCQKVFDVCEEFNKWTYSKVEIELPLNLDLVLFVILDKSEKKLHKKPYNTIN